MSPADGAAAAPMVAIRGLRKRFGANEVLKGVDLSVAAGEVIAVIGRSGSTSQPGSESTIVSMSTSTEPRTTATTRSSLRWSGW